MSFGARAATDLQEMPSNAAVCDRIGDACHTSATARLQLPL
jgi:hypothetical protein